MSPALLRDGPRPDYGVAADRAPRRQRHPAPPSDLRPPEPALAAVVELDRRRAWRVDGATSMVAWLVQRCGVSAATAREWVTAAAKLPRCPKISDALSQGKLSFDQVKPLVEVAKPETDAAAGRTGDALVGQAGPRAGHGRAQPDPTSGRPASTPVASSASTIGAGPWPACSPRTSTPWSRARSWPGPARRRRDRTPFDQRMADALVAVCKGDAAEKRRRPVDRAPAARQAGGLRRNRPTVVVHADLTFLAGGEGGAELDVLGPVSREVARRLACDAKVLVSADDPDGRSLNLGRTRRDPERRPAGRDQAARQGMPLPRLHHTEFTDVHHVGTGSTAADRPRQPGRAVRPASPLRPRDGLEDLGRRQRGADLPEPDGTAFGLDPVPAFTAARDGPPG